VTDPFDDPDACTQIEDDDPESLAGEPLTDAELQEEVTDGGDAD
jgi:hypothetical protein